MDSMKVEKDGIIYMGYPYVFNKDNIEQFAAIF